MTILSSSFVSIVPVTSARRAAFAALFGFVVAFAATAAPQAQEAMQAPPRAIAVPPSQDQRIPTLGCCQCLGKQNILDLSTTPGNPWLVNGQPAVAVTAPNAAWAPAAPAKWVSINAAANGGNNTTYHYTLQFKVEKCTIPQTIVFKGISAAADNYIKVWLTGPSGGGPVQCTVAGGYCFTPSNKLVNFAAWPVTVAPGLYTLNVDVTNISGPTGMFMNAVVEGKCTKDAVKPEKN